MLSVSGPVSEPEDGVGGGQLPGPPFLGRTAGLTWRGRAVSCLIRGRCLLVAALAWSPALAPGEDSGAWDQTLQSLFSALFPQHVLAGFTLHQRVNGSL